MLAIGPVTKAARGATAILAGSLLTAGYVRSAASAPVLGAEGCRPCHETEYAIWRSSAHARALDGLDQRQQKDRRCRQCHATIPDSDAPQARGEQCEACHGAGRVYAFRFVMKDPELARALGLEDPTEAGCRACHNETAPSLAPFDFAGAVRRIAHGQRRAAHGAEAPTGGAPVKEASRTGGP